MKKVNFIAELCQNHLGKTKNVEKMLAQCAYYGAKTVKLQYIYAKNLSFRPRFENGIKGRFSSKINNATRDIYNWEEIKI